MNICFFSGDITRSGGTERVVLILANALAHKKDKYSIHILSLENETDDPFFEVSPIIKLAKVFAEPTKKSRKTKFAKIVRKIRKYVLQNKIEIFIDVDTILSLYSLPALAYTDTKHIAWEHFSFHQNLGTRLRTWGRKYAAKYSDATVVLTKKDKKNFIENFRTQQSVYHIYNPLVLNKASTENLYDKTSKVILSAGRLTHQKGFDLLIDVAAEVFRKHSDWKWLILGEGEDRAYLEDRIQQLGLQKQLILMGDVSNIEEYYSKAAMFVLTSRFEPFGLVLTEAKSFYLPCISFDVEAGPAEIILNLENGYLIEPFQIEDMAGAINYLIENPAERIKQSQKALNDTEKFDLEQIIGKWESLFHQI